jgi:hypothetical protein
MFKVLPNETPSPIDRRDSVDDARIAANIVTFPARQEAGAEPQTDPGGPGSGRATHG